MINHHPQNFPVGLFPTSPDEPPSSAWFSRINFCTWPSSCLRACRNNLERRAAPCEGEDKSIEECWYSRRNAWTHKISPTQISSQLLYASIYLSTGLLLDLSVSLSIYLPIYLSTYLSIYLSIDLSIYRYIDLSVFSINQSIYRSIYLSIYPSICLSIYLSLSSMRVGLIFRRDHIQKWTKAVQTKSNGIVKQNCRKWKTICFGAPKIFFHVYCYLYCL